MKVSDFTLELFSHCFFLAATPPPHMVRFISSSDHNVPIPAAGLLAVPHAADFLVCIVILTDVD